MCIITEHDLNEHLLQLASNNSTAQSEASVAACLDHWTQTLTDLLELP